MAYLKCPTCNRLIADKMIPYEEAVKKLESSNLSTKQLETEKMKIFDNLKIPRDRYCCRMRLMTYRDLVAIVK